MLVKLNSYKREKERDSKIRRGREKKVLECCLNLNKSSYLFALLGIYKQMQITSSQSFIPQTKTKLIFTEKHLKNEKANTEDRDGPSWLVTMESF